MAISKRALHKHPAGANKQWPSKIIKGIQKLPGVTSKKSPTGKS